MLKKASFITSSCLIAADIDKTFLRQEDGEKKEFEHSIASQLLNCAENGTNIALVTGNSFEELCTRFLTYLLTFMNANSYEPILLSKFHFFCNSGGVYFHFPDKSISKISVSGKLEIDKIIKYYQDKTPSQIMPDQIMPDQVMPEFINKEYLDKTFISKKDANQIKRILINIWNRYKTELDRNKVHYGKHYYIDSNPVKNSDSCRYPVEQIEEDSNKNLDFRYFIVGRNKKSTVQITLKPVLSWRHAKQPITKINKDLRSKIIDEIHRELDRHNLSGFTARPGGRSSIDVTRAKLDKAYALRFLIEHLGIEGNERHGKKFGSNVIYLGDEVISGGGNDFPVTKIDGLLVMAVNKIPEYVPFSSRIIIPKAFTGPDASNAVLTEYNAIVQEELKKCESGNYTPTCNAIQLFKKKWFSEKISKKINLSFFKEKLSVDELQILYLFITLIGREDGTARKWVNILVKMLDESMEALDKNERVRLAGIGSSSPQE